MQNIFLIQCAKKKLPHAAKASELYISPLFRMSLEYAKRRKPDAIYILSAKHWLVELDEVIAPYELTLNKMSSAERKAWAEIVIQQLAKRADLHTDHFTLLAGQMYGQYLLPVLKSAVIPLMKKPIGKQLQFLSMELSK